MRKAFWIWNIPNCEGGDPLAIAAVAARAGLTDVFVKVADGVVKFGIYNKVDVVPPVIAALKTLGIRVWGWQYVYGNDPAKEEQIASARIKELGLDHFIVNAEVEFKKAGWGARAETYLTRLRQNNPGLTVAFSSFRYPNVHPEFPWAVFYKYCDINMPQVYWLQAANAGYQTQLSIDKFRAMGKLSILPAAPPWKENGWRPTLAQQQEFEQVAQKNGIELVSYWSWEHCRRDLPELWPKEADKKPANDPSAGERIVILEQRIAALHAPLQELKEAGDQLEGLIKALL